MHLSGEAVALSLPRNLLLFAHQSDIPIRLNHILEGF